MTDTQALVERLAGEAGFVTKFNDTGERLAKFAELVARECMKLCEEMDADPHVVLHVGTVCAAAIRQRFGVGE